MASLESHILSLKLVGTYYPYCDVMKHVHQSVWVHYIPMINNIVQNAQQRVLSMTIIVLQVL